MCPPLVPILNYMNPVLTLPPNLRSIVMLLSNVLLDFITCSLSFKFYEQNLVCISHFFHACFMTHPFHSPWFDWPNNVRWRAQILNFLLCSFLVPSITSSFLGLHILLSALFSKTLNVCYSLLSVCLGWSWVPRYLCFKSLGVC
jgi:hypothetical protein